MATLLKIVNTIENAQVKTVMADNSQLLCAYWVVGNELSEKITSLQWGAKVIEILSTDICRKFPKLKGFSPRNLH